MLAITQGKKQPAEWVQVVWQVLASQGQQIIKDGKTLDTPEQNIAELTEQTEALATKQVPILKAFGTPRLDMCAVFPGHRFVPRRVRAFVDFLAARLGPEPYWDQGLSLE